MYNALSAEVFVKKQEEMKLGRQALRCVLYHFWLGGLLFSHEYLDIDFLNLRDPD